MRFAGRYLDFAGLHNLVLSEAEKVRSLRTADGSGVGEDGGESATSPRAPGVPVGRQALSAAESAPLSARFAAALHAELVKIDVWVAAQQASQVEDLAACVRARNAGRTDARSLVIAERAVWRRSAELRDFVELNYSAVYKLVKKVDKELGTHMLDATLWMVEQMPFFKLMDPAGGGTAAASRVSAAGGGVRGGVAQHHTDLEGSDGGGSVGHSGASDDGGGGGGGRGDGGGSMEDASHADTTPPPEERFLPLVDSVTAVGIAAMLRETFAQGEAAAKAEAAAAVPVADTDRDSAASGGGDSAAGGGAGALPDAVEQPALAVTAADAALAASLQERLGAQLRSSSSKPMIGESFFRPPDEKEILKTAALESQPAAVPPAAAAVASAPVVPAAATSTLSVTARERERVRGVREALRQFRRAQAKIFAVAGAVLDLISPELAASEAERAKRLALVSAHLLACHAVLVREAAVPDAQPSVLHERSLAFQLDLIWHVLQLLERELDMTVPEAAAALELVAAAFVGLFAARMSPGIVEQQQASANSRVSLAAALRAPADFMPPPLAAALAPAQSRSRASARLRSLRRATGTGVASAGSAGASAAAASSSGGESSAAGGTRDRSPAVSSAPPMRARLLDDSRGGGGFGSIVGGGAYDERALMSVDETALPLPTASAPGAAAATTGIEHESQLPWAAAAAHLGDSTRNLLVAPPSSSSQLRAAAPEIVLSVPAPAPPAAAAEPAAPGRLPLFSQLSTALRGFWSDLRASWPHVRLAAAVAVGLAEDDGGVEGAESAAAAAAAAGRSDSSVSESSVIAARLWRRWRPPIFRWLPHYDWAKRFSSDALAGATIGVLLVPQGLAYAVLAGVPPVYGVYTGLPAVVYAIFGTSRHAAVGPMSVPALLMATAVAGLSPPPATVAEYTANVMALTMMCGALLFVLGWLQAGFIVRFISAPVLSGFTSAAAILTMASVTGDLLGAPVPRSQQLQGAVVGIAGALPSTNLPSLAIGLGALALLFGAPRVRALKRVPAPLLAVGVATAGCAMVMAATGDTGVSVGTNGAAATRAGVALVGVIPAAFPAPALPPMGAFVQLAPAAVSIAFVGFIESIAVAKLYSSRFGYDIAPSSELKALGLTNMAGAAVAQSFLVMGAFGRSAVNVDAGARSQLSGIVSALVVVALLAVAMPALYYLPRPVLAALIIAAVVKLIDARGAARLWRADRRDWLAMAAAFTLTLFVGVLPGIVLSMTFSLLLFIAVTTQPQVRELGRLTGSVIYRELGEPGVERVPAIKLLRFAAPLFFANAAVLRERVQTELGRRRWLPPRLQWRALILDMAAVASVDSTAARALEDALDDARAQGVPMVLAGANAAVEASLAAAGVLARHAPAPVPAPALAPAAGASDAQPTSAPAPPAPNVGHRRLLYRRSHEAVHALLLELVPTPAAQPLLASPPGLRRGSSYRTILPPSPDSVQPLEP